jgi:hypothetical protein
MLGIPFNNILNFLSFNEILERKVMCIEKNKSILENLNLKIKSQGICGNWVLCAQIAVIINCFLKSLHLQTSKFCFLCPQPWIRFALFFTKINEFFWNWQLDQLNCFNIPMIPFIKCAIFILRPFYIHWVLPFYFTSLT